MPSSPATYLLELSGLPWWMGKVRVFARLLRGDVSGMPYIAADALPSIRRSVALQIATYAALAAFSLWHPNGLLWWNWLLPLALGQPFLRFLLMAEHNGCAYTADMTANTRTTLTVAPIRWLMWEMPFHAEHHLYPSIPFHALKRAHPLLLEHLRHCAPGYLAVHRELLADLPRLAPPQPA